MENGPIMEHRFALGAWRLSPLPTNSLIKSEILISDNQDTYLIRGQLVRR
jgi:hypothetical protein